MRPADVFGIVVRTVGWLAVFNGGWWLLLGLKDLAISQAMDSGKLEVFVWGVLCVLAGLIQVRLADRIARFAYPGMANATAEGVKEVERRRAA